MSSVTEENDCSKIKHRSPFKVKRNIISDSDDDDDDSCTTSMSSNTPASKSNEKKEINEISSPNKKWEGPDMKLNLKPLGFDKNLEKWIESTKNHPIIASSSISDSKDKLKSGKTTLKDMQIEILEKFYTAMCNIPVAVLSKFPQFDEDLFQKLKMLNQRVKAKLRQTERRLLVLNDQTKTNLSNDHLEKVSSIETSSKVSLIETSSHSSKSNCTIEKSKSTKIHINKDMSDRDYSSTSQEKCDINEKSQNRLSSSNDYLPKHETSSSNEPTTPIPNKRKSQFQLKVPVKATLSPEVSKKLEKMMEKRNTEKISSDESQKKVALNLSSNDSTDTESNSCDKVNYSKPATTFEKVSTNVISSSTTNNIENSTVNKSKPYNKNENSWKNKFDSSFEDEEMLNDNSADISDLRRPTSNTSLNFSQNSSVNKIPIADNEIEFEENSLNVNTSGKIPKDGDSREFDGIKYPHSQEMMTLFRQKFGLYKFRPNQLQAINAAVLGHDCFILMPTGGGKSLCYQLPGLLSTGITIVVSPLKSLILDQTQKLITLDIPAAHMSGDITDAQSDAIYREMSKKEPVLKFLYVTPEKISASQKLCNALTALYQRGQLARFVIDEAHCVSQWGHDFRPDYKRLNVLRQKYPKVPTMALTATATPRVRTDILFQLGMKSPKWFMSSFNRPNLRYSVINKKGKNSSDEVIGMIKAKFKNDCGIVYCISRNDCDTYAQQMRVNGIKAMSYHAGLSDKQRNEIQGRWISEQVNVVCATIAFGMGIDKPNVRFVIHAALPKSIEGYYQESGRAGRDSDTAECMLFYFYGDMYRHRKMIELDVASNKDAKKTHLDNLFKMVSYCENTTDCRRAVQLNYFGELFDRQICMSDKSTACDNCRNQNQFSMQNVTEDAKALVTLIRDFTKSGNRITVLQIVEVFKGSDLKKIRDLGHDTHPFYGKGKSWTKHDIERLLHKLVLEDYLAESMYMYNEITCAYLGLGPKARDLMTTNTIKITLETRKAVEKATASATVTNVTVPDDNALKDVEQRCYTELAQMVNGIAGALDVSANSIMNMVAVRIMSQQLPETEEGMLKIPHVTKANYDKYGAALLDITKKYAAEKKEVMKKFETTKAIAAASVNADYDASLEDDDWVESVNSISASVKRKRGRGRSRGSAKRFRGSGSRKTTSSRGSSKSTRGKSKSTRGRGRGRGASNSNKGPGLVEFSQKKEYLNHPNRYISLL